MQSTHTAAKHTAGYRPLDNPQLGADWQGSDYVWALIFMGAAVMAAVFAWRIARWIWRKTA